MGVSVAAGLRFDHTNFLSESDSAEGLQEITHCISRSQAEHQPGGGVTDKVSRGVCRSFRLRLLFALLWEYNSHSEGSLGLAHFKIRLCVCGGFS